MQMSMSYFAGFEISQSDNSGEAEFTVKISGSHHDGKALVYMIKTNQGWQFDEVWLTASGKEQVKLAL